MRYVGSRLDEKSRETAYRIYVTDTLQLLGKGYVRDQRFADLVYPPKEETRTADEVIGDIKAKLEKVK